jgi:hypothetical protein
MGSVTQAHLLPHVGLEHPANQAQQMDRRPCLSSARDLASLLVVVELARLAFLSALV